MLTYFHSNQQITQQHPSCFPLNQTLATFPMHALNIITVKLFCLTVYEMDKVANCAVKWEILRSALLEPLQDHTGGSAGFILISFWQNKVSIFPNHPSAFKLISLLSGDTWFQLISVKINFQRLDICCREIIITANFKPPLLFSLTLANLKL